MERFYIPLKLLIENHSGVLRRSITKFPSSTLSWAGKFRKGVKIVLGKNEDNRKNIYFTTVIVGFQFCPFLPNNKLLVA